MRGVGADLEGRGDQGGRRCWRRNREMAAVVVTRGIVAASEIGRERLERNRVLKKYDILRGCIGE